MKKQKTKAPGPVQDTIVMRMATALDCTPIFKLLMAYFEMNPAMGPVNPTSTMCWGLSVIAQNQCVVATLGGRIIGSAAFEVHFFPWNPDRKWLNMVWFYVVPEKRSGGTANRLDKAMMDIAIARELPLRSDNIWGIDPEIQDRWRRQRGYKYLGGNFGFFPPPPGGDADGVQH